MVLPTSPPDAQLGPGSVTSWAERVARLFRLVERGILALVDRANDAELGTLVRALVADHPDLRVLTEAAQVEQVPHGSVLVLAIRPEDATWLNMARPIFAERALRVVLWSHAEVTASLARRAPDFFDWVGRRFECPSGPPAFTVRGLQASLRARAWAVAFRGPSLETAFAVAFPKRALVKANATMPDDELVAVARGAGASWIAWSNILDERAALRIRKLVNRAGRRGRNILDNPLFHAPEAWPVHDSTVALPDAAKTLAAAGALQAGRLAALLDLEPEAVGLAADQLEAGDSPAKIEAAIVSAVDPGAAMGRLAGSRANLDPILVAAYRVSAPFLRAFAADPQVRKASAILAGRVHPMLPPLTERIPLGPDGAAEFERLVLQLLRDYVGRRRLVVSSSTEDIGVDAIAPDGLPEMEGGVAFEIKYGRGPFRLERAIERASGDKNLSHWVLVTPYDSTPADRERLRDIRRSPSLRVHHWGQTWIEHLLRRSPPLLARYYPKEARDYLPGYDGTDFATLADRYREKVSIRHNRIKTIGIPPEARPRHSRVELPLADLFIPFLLLPEEPNAWLLDLAQTVERARCAVVLADPGMGKSTLLSYLALVFAGGTSLEGFTCPPRSVPLFVSLRDFVRRQRARPGLSFLEYLELDARAWMPEMHRAFFEASLRMGEAVVLFDGLDEVGNESTRHAVASSIRMFQADYPDCRVWVTSRIYGYTDTVRLPKPFLHFHIGRLSDPQIDSFVGRWYGLQIAAHPQEAAEQTASLQAAVRHTPSVRRLAGNPLLLTLMAFIHQGIRRLPRDRGELYEKCIEMLLKTWEQGKRHDDDPPAVGLLNAATLKDYLAHLAFFVQQKNQDRKDDARGLVARQDALAALAMRHLPRARRDRPEITEFEAREEMTAVLEYVCDKTGLLVDRGDDHLSFIHLSFQEYLAAWVFVCGTDLPRGPTFFVEHLGDPAWEEVLLLRLYVVLLGGGGGEVEFDRILEALFRSLERTNVAAGWMTLLRAVRDDLELRDVDRRKVLARALNFWLEEPTFESTWFDALEEVRLFAERSGQTLRTVIKEARKRARSTDAIALLHLEARLFAFPADAADDLVQRKDLADLLPSLVPFVNEPGIRSLLAERGSVRDWSRALRALDGPEVYRLTVRWMTASPTPAAVEAATAWLWEKILVELHSRKSFAEKHGEHADRLLFEQPGALSHSNRFSSVTLPFVALRALPASLPALASTAVEPMACPSLQKARLKALADTDAWRELTTWTASFIASLVDRFPIATSQFTNAAPDLAELLVKIFVRDFVDDFVRGLAREFVRDMDPAFISLGSGGAGLDRDMNRYVRRVEGHLGKHGVISRRDLMPFREDSSVIRSVVGLGGAFACQSVRHFALPFVRDFGRDFVRDFGRSFGHHLGGDFGHDFVRGFVRQFGFEFGVDPGRLVWESEWNRAMDEESNRLRLLDRLDFWCWALSAWGELAVTSCEAKPALHPALTNPLGLPLLLTDVWRTAAAHVLLTFVRLAVEHDGVDSERWLQRNPIEVYATAFAWQEHCEGVTKLEGPVGALVIAHAAYASLLTGLSCKLPVEPDVTDARVRCSHILYGLCNFEDVDANVHALEEAIASPAVEARPLLEAAGLSLPATPSE
jgi:hypothetical protein